ASAAPNSGAAAGGTTVVLTGTDLTGTTAVDFGATPAASFTVDSATQITAVSPAGTGTVQITATTGGGTSNGVAFTFI
ncbi:IPT/TIG domain-containing protein, partial [Nocardia pneumoniae]|uniref:IPT/TIG domain-containing protein n=1 Tax=Nocardia pneumoniae TaxID=228601 RepID=UPI0005941F60